MVLQKQEVKLDLQKSTDQITNDKVTNENALTQNIRFIKNQGAQKRNGQVNADSSSSLTNVKSVFTFKGVTYVSCNEGIQAYNDSLGKLERLQRRPLTALTKKEIATFNNDFDVTSVKVAQGDGILFTAYSTTATATALGSPRCRMVAEIMSQDGSRIKKIFDEEGYYLSSSGTPIEIARYYKAPDWKIDIISYNYTDGKLYRRTFKEDGEELSTIQSGFGDLISSDVVLRANHMRVSIDRFGLRYYIVYYDSATDLIMQVYTASTDTYDKKTADTSGYHADNRFTDAICMDSYVIASVQNVGTHVARLDRLSRSQALRTAIPITTTGGYTSSPAVYLTRKDGTTYFVYAGFRDLAFTEQPNYMTTAWRALEADTALSSSFVQYFYGAMPLSGGFYEPSKDKFYLNLVDCNDYQPFIYLMEHDETTYDGSDNSEKLHFPVFALYPTFAPNDFLQVYSIRETRSPAVSLGSGQWITAYPLRSTNYREGEVSPAYAHEYLYRCNLVKYDFDAISPKYIESNDNVIMADGRLSTFDGDVMYHALNVTPQFTVKTYGSEQPDRYLYKAVYTVVDGNNNKIRSLPSDVITSYGPVRGSPTFYLINKEALLQSWMYAFSDASSPKIHVEYYTTELNGTVFYLAYVGDIGGTLPVTDVPVDAILIGNEILYTTGGVLENVNPATANSVASFGGRVWYSADDDSIGYSKIVQDQRPPEFNDGLTFRIPGKNIVAIGSLIRRLLVLKEDECWSVWGNPANNAGLGQALSSERMSKTIGCINPNSVVNSNIGIFFLSQRMIYLAGYDLSLKPVGASVVDYTDDYTIVATAENKKYKEVYFFTEEDYILVYNYLFDIWSIFPDLEAKAGTFTDGLLYRVSDTQLFKEDESSRQDNGANYSFIYETGWLKFGKINGFQRIWRLHLLGSCSTALDLRVTTWVDYNETTPAQVKTFSFSARDPMEIELHMAKQKCTAMKIRIEDVTTAIDSTDLTVSAVSLQVGVKKGFNKIAPAKRG